jgi:hypothetical protein
MAKSAKQASNNVVTLDNQLVVKAKPMPKSLAKVNDVKPSEKAINLLTTQGQKLAVTMLEIENKASMAKRTALMNIASLYYNKAQTTILLDSYALALKGAGQNDNTIKVRKSEAKTVIDCVVLTEVTKTHEIALNAFEGGFHAFISYARDLTSQELAKKGIVKLVKATKTESLELSEKQADYINDLSLKASPQQVLTLVANSTIKLEVTKQLQLIASLLNNIIDNDSNESKIKIFAMDTLKNVNLQLDELASTAKKSQDAINMVKNSVHLSELPLAEI